LTLSSPSSAAPITKAAAVKQLRKDVKPVVAALAKFGVKVKKWNNSTPVAAVASAMKPLGTAFQNFSFALLRVSWPRNARADVRAVYFATSPIVADINSVAALNGNDSTAISAWVSGMEKDVAAWENAIVLVEHDLGLRVG